MQIPMQYPRQCPMQTPCNTHVITCAMPHATPCKPPCNALATPRATHSAMPHAVPCDPPCNTPFCAPAPALLSTFSPVLPPSPSPRSHAKPNAPFPIPWLSSALGATEKSLSHPALSHPGDALPAHGGDEEGQGSWCPCSLPPPHPPFLPCLAMTLPSSPCPCRHCHHFE